ncbi:MAG: efflux RND transporter periplasmic adaptor subunit [Chloroflexi bacterium]|nr:efflux RND transporter periplasmic adaptor subunit [Chloroflexota bacterium]
MKRGVTIIAILAVVLGLSYLLYTTLGPARAPQQPDYQTVAVQRGDVSAYVSAVGSIEPQRSVSLRFRGMGSVTAVHVDPGQAVAEGDLLAELESAELDLAVRQAEASLVISQARLDQLTAGASAEEIVAAETALASAQASYERVLAGPGQADLAAARVALSSAQKALQKLLAGPSEDEVAGAKANLERARLALERAQSEYDRVAWVGGVGALPQSLALQQATVDYETAEANYRLATEGATAAQVEAGRAQVAQAEASLQRLLDSPSDAEIMAAETQVAQARYQLDRLRSGAREEERRIAEAQVAQAQIALEQAQLQRDNATLRAPFAGVVAEVNVKEGEQVQSALPAITLIDDSAFHINVAVDELDIATLREGQETHISFDSLPDQVFGGRVTRVAPTATSVMGVAGYQVRIDLEPTEAPLRVGMSATVDIITAYAADTLTLANRAIQFDRRTEQTYVDKLVGFNLVRTEIQVGIQGDQATEILSGLSEGDQVAVVARTGAEQLISTFGQ